MKKLPVSILTALVLSSSFITPLRAASESDPVAVGSIKTAEAAKAEVLLARLEEINAMDKSSLTKPEKNR